MLIGQALTHKASAGFIQRVKADDVGQILHPFCDLHQTGRIMVLQIVLHILTINDHVGRKIAACKKQRPHDAVGGQAIVLRPGHGGVIVFLTAAARIVIFILHDMGSTCLMELGEVETNLLENPCRGAIAPSHATPDVLMKVHKHIKTILTGPAAKLRVIIKIVRVVFSRTCMLNCFPSGQQPQTIETPCCKS